MTPLDYASQICYSTRETLQFTYDMAVKYKDVLGVYVECGVAAGAQIIAMAYGAPEKTIYAFDSFEGIPLPSNRDDQMPGIKMLTANEQKALPNPGEQKLESSGATSVSFNDFWIHVDNSGVSRSHIIPVIGWFEETTSVDYIKDISILRLDGDLYNSTYVCLKNLYPKVVKGGMIIIDDWALPGCRASVQDYLISIKQHKKLLDIQFINCKDSTIAFFIK